MVAKAKMLTTSSALRVVDIADIKFDDSYQRGEVKGHKRIVAEFDEHALGVPLVGQREDGTLWCVDGRQRLTALKKLGKKTVRAEVFVSQGPEHEAQVFKLVNAGRTKLNPGELFKAKLTAGDKDAWAVKEAVEGAGFRLECSRPTRRNSEHSWKYVTAFSTLERIYRMGGKSAERITRILIVVGEAWPGDMFATNSDILGGLGQFYANRGDEMVDDQRLADRLRATTPTKIVYTAGLGIGGRHANVAEVIARLYARRKQKRNQPAAAEPSI
jgi:hypothetical protein